VDCNHANSMKLWQEQSRIAMEVMSHARHNTDIKDLVKGLMIESYLVGGTQPVNGTTFGQSITDGCLSWESSENLIFQIADCV